MAELISHNNNMSKSSPLLGHMHAKPNSMTNGYAGAFQFWKSKEQDQPQSTPVTINSPKQSESPTLGSKTSSRRSSISSTSSPYTPRDLSPISLHSKTLQCVEEDDEISGGISRERSSSVAVMPRSSSHSADLNPSKKKTEIKHESLPDIFEEAEEDRELDRALSSASSEVDVDSPVQSSPQLTSPRSTTHAPKKVERKLRSRDESASVPKLVLAHSASTADTTRHKLVASPVALSARQAHSKGLSHSDKDPLTKTNLIWLSL
eukprot:TRINITY_DN4630_c0_g2_i1.p1 TRINITY_DN4630_c0_g2~~TRINITY_DN4630_c0_g2_i1.p1  ORF type:complete len:291 (-),score=17.24 TRINITY_DN4630_c0_g2_i1:108-896(-)